MKLNKKLIADVLENYLIINGDEGVLEEGFKLDVNEQIKQLRKVEIDEEALQNLMYNQVYYWLVRDGRDLQYDEAKAYFQYMGLCIDEQYYKNAHDFARDLYDDNEANGYNDQMYPDRRK